LVSENHELSLGEKKGTVNFGVLIFTCAYLSAELSLSPSSVKGLRFQIPWFYLSCPLLSRREFYLLEERQGIYILRK
jgi:hypothetical protein